MKSGKSSFSTRDTVLEILCQSVRSSTHLQELVAQNGKFAILGKRDKALALDMVYGYTRQKIRIDFILSRFLAKPQKLPTAMLVSLGMGVYSMLFQDNMPDYAAIDETVKLIKKRYGSRLAKVANGVLRSMQRLGSELYNPAWYSHETGDDWAGICVFYAMPQFLADKWLEAWGRDMAVQLMRRAAMRPRPALRVNRAHRQAALVRDALKSAYNADFVGDYGFAFAPGYLPETILSRDLSFWQSEGVISLQSAGSMQIMEELGLYAWEEPVWDCAAGVGGKSAMLLETGVNVAISTDTSYKRLKSLPGLCERLRLQQPLVAVADGRFPPFGQWSGHILLDAPCSGLGILGRRPDIRHMSEPAKFDSLVNLQASLLSTLARILKPGRELAYITCTLNPPENEGQIKKLLSATPAMKLVAQWQTPHDHPWMEGMFGAVLRKQ